VEVNLSQECEVEPNNLAAQLVLQLSPGPRRDVLLVHDAPIDVLDPDHRSGPTPFSGPGWLRALGTLLPAWIWRC